MPFSFIIKFSNKKTKTVINESNVDTNVLWRIVLADLLKMNITPDISQFKPCQFVYKCKKHKSCIRYFN